VPERRELVRRVLHAAGVEHERRALRLDAPAFRRDRARPWNGLVTSPDLLGALEARFGDTVWSASQLETYGRCPFTFFVRYVLDVRALDEPDEEMDGATRGALLHRCLQELHDDLAATLGDDALTAQGRRRAEHHIPRIVERALAEQEKLGRPGIPELRAYRAAELAETLRRYVAWEVAENEKAQRRATPRRRPVRTELVFGMDGVPPVTLQRGGRTLRLRGKIDRVDELLDAPVRGRRYVVDHKSGAGSLSPLGLYDEGALLQLPLYLHALERMPDGGAGVWGGAYQVVGDECKRAAALHPMTLTSAGKVREGSTSTEQESAARLHGALDNALAHVDAIAGGRFPAVIPNCAKSCPSYCDTRDLCREDVAGRRPR